MHAHAVLFASAASAPLHGARAGNPLDAELLNAAFRVVTGEAYQPGIDHIADAGDRDGCLRHVRCQHDPAVRGLRREDAFLFGRAHASKERQDLRVRIIAPGQHVGAVADFAFAGQKNEDAAAFARVQQVFHTARDGFGKFLVLKRLQIDVLDREHASADLDDRGVAEK